MTPGRWGLLIAASLAVAVLQLTVADQFSLAGMHSELLWVLPVAVGFAAGSTPGMAAGFVAGAIGDLFVPAPFGLSALVGVLIGYGIGVLGDEGVGDLLGAAFFVAPGLAAVAGFAAPIGYAMLGAIGGHASYVSEWVLVVGLLDAATCALLVRPAMWLLGAPMSGDGSRAGALEPVRGTM